MACEVPEPADDLAGEGLAWAGLARDELAGEGLAWSELAREALAGGSPAACLPGACLP